MNQSGSALQHLVTAWMTVTLDDIWMGNVWNKVRRTLQNDPRLQDAAGSHCPWDALQSIGGRRTLQQEGQEGMSGPFG